ncbi:MAG: DMT family transporter [Bacteroidales bacterium]|jgi:drug/metabolite transporter (DMT)-like permease|nr:DMT family transporter [Bacteroidales bacterium]
MEKSRLSYIYAGVAVFFWSTIPTAFKICLAEMEILTMLSIATFTSAAALFLILAAEGKLSLIKLNTPRQLLGSALLGFINPFVYYLILLKAYQLLPAQVAQPLNMIWPIILVFLSVPILKQKIAARSFVALFISFVGVYIISSQGNIFFRDHADLKGVLLATGSSVFWAFYFIMNVRDPRDEAVKLFLNFLFASVVLAVIMILTGRWDGDAGHRGIIAAVYIGLFEMGITFFLWLKALQLASSTDKVSNLVYLAPFLSLVFVHFILGEPLFYTTPAGLLLIVFGILIQSRRVGRN